MKKVFILFGIFSLLFFSNRKINSQDKVKRVFVFVVDLSGSMQKDGLHNKVKMDFVNFITKKNEQGKNNLNIGDRVILMGFGDNVSYFWDKEITKVEDLEELANIVNKLVFNHKWTHMSRAFDMLATRMKEIHISYPEAQKIIYIYTDGKNEPPPEIGESPLAFSEILNQYWEKCWQQEKEKMWLYFITFGVPAPEEIRKWAEKNDHVIISEKTRTIDITETVIPSPPPIQPSEALPSVPEKKFNFKKFIIFIGIPLFLVIILIVYFLTIPKFPDNYYILELNQRNDELMRWNIRRYQRFYTNKVVISKDIKIQDLNKNAFVIKIEKNMELKIMPINSEIIIEKNAKELIPQNKWYVLPENDIFTCDNKRFCVKREV